MLDLSAYGRELYVEEIETEPAVTGWEASFDAGATWHDGDAVDGEPNTWRWLVHGPLAAAPTDDTSPSVLVVAGASPFIHYPLLRAVDNPEAVVRSGSPIQLLHWPAPARTA